MKKIVITGPTGAIGLALIQTCMEKDITVTAVCRPGSKRIKRIPQSDRVKVVECPLDSLSQLKEELTPDYDTFFHLGWSGTTGQARMDEKQQMKNVDITLDAVELAKALGCHTFVGAGSQAEYGRVNGRLSSDTPTNPESWYGKAKLLAGMRSRETCEKFQMCHIWTRILSVYGPGDSENSMIMSTTRKLLAGERPRLTKGEQQWDYMSCQDTGKALYLLGEKGLHGKVYCLGSGKARPLREYMEILRDKINPEAELGIGEIPYGDKQVMYLCADITELKEDTGFVPNTEFEDGICDVIQWCREQEREG